MIPQGCRPHNAVLNTNQSNIIGQQENFEPFTPELDLSTKPMQIISNLHQMKECEFDHEYISQHLEQLQMDQSVLQLPSIFFHQNQLSKNYTRKVVIGNNVQTQYYP